MPPEKSELDKLFEDLPSDSHQTTTTDNTPKDEDDKGDNEPDDDKKPNRRQRRAIENESIRTQLQRERDLRIAAEARAQALSEKPLGDGQVDERLLRMYGEDENGRLAAKIHQDILEDVRKKAVEEARNELIQQRQAEEEKVRQEEQFIDNELTALEDEYNVDLTSNSSQGRKNREEFLVMVEELSPKDDKGNILAYADFNAVFKQYQSSKKVDNSLQKQLASRGMQKSGTVNMTKEDDDKNRSWLRSIGIKV